MFINIESRLDDALADILEPGEQAIATSYGMHCVSAAAERWIWILGLGIGGFLLLTMLHSKVFVVLTDRRLIIIELWHKGLRVAGVRSLALGQIEKVELNEGWSNNELTFDADGEAFRFKLLNFAIGFNDAKERSIHLAESLRQAALAGKMSSLGVKSPTFQVANGGEIPPVAAKPSPRKASREPSLPFFLPLFLSALVAIPMGFIGFLAVLVAAGTIWEPKAMSNLMLLAVYLTALVPPALGVALMVFWVRSSRARALTAHREQSGELETGGAKPA